MTQNQFSAQFTCNNWILQYVAPLQGQAGGPVYDANLIVASGQKTEYSSYYGTFTLGTFNWFVFIVTVVRSLTTPDGDPVFPREWNHEFIDLPLIKNQHQPTLAKEEGRTDHQQCEGLVSDAVFSFGGNRYASR